MIRFRTIALTLLLLLGIAGAGVYLLLHLPELLRLQARNYLQQYGVDDIHFEGLHAGPRGAGADYLVLHGAYDNYAYEVTLNNGQVQYDWRAVLGGKVGAIRLSSLDIVVEQTGDSTTRGRQALLPASLLPQRVMAQLPLASLDIAQWNLRYHSPQIGVIDASGELAFDTRLDARLTTTLANRRLLAELQSGANPDSMHLNLSVHENQADITTVSARLSAAAQDTWVWDIQATAQHTPLIQWLRELEQSWNITPGIPSATAFTLLGNSVLTARIQHPEALMLGAQAQFVDAARQQLQASFLLSNEIRRLDLGAVASGISGTVTFEGELAQGRFESALQPFKVEGLVAPKTLSLPADWVHWMRLGDDIPLTLHTTEPVQIISPAPGSWSVGTENALISLGDKASLISLHTRNLDFTMRDEDPLQASTALTAVLDARLRKQALPALELAFTQRGNPQHSALSLQVADTARSLQAALSGDLDLATGEGKFQLDTQVTNLQHLWANSAPLLRHFDLLNNTLDLRSGTARLRTDVRGKRFDIASWEQQSYLSLESTAGSLDGVGFEGLSVSAGWTGIDRWKTLQPVEITLASLTPGFVVSDVRLRASLPRATPIARPQVSIEAFSADMFGGKLTLPAAQSWDFAAPGNSITLLARQWQLGDLVALQHNADIEAQGTLEGELPLTVTGSRIIIDKGYLRALPPGGLIRYIATDANRALASNNPELEMALNLLSDFRYQRLQSAVELDEAGNLLLGLSLAGSNPSQFDGQAINFNINVEQNIDPLLQSLRLSDNLVKRIESGLE